MLATRATSVATPTCWCGGQTKLGNFANVQAWLIRIARPSFAAAMPFHCTIIPLFFMGTWKDGNMTNTVVKVTPFWEGTDRANLASPTSHFNVTLGLERNNFRTSVPGNFRKRNT